MMPAHLLYHRLHAIQPAQQLHRLFRQVIQAFGRAHPHLRTGSSASGRAPRSQLRPRDRLPAPTSAGRGRGRAREGFTESNPGLRAPVKHPAAQLVTRLRAHQLLERLERASVLAGLAAWELACYGVGLAGGLGIVMQQFSRQHVVDELNHLGHRELADEASQDLPDPVDVDRLAAWGIQHGLTLNDLISEAGGSP